MRGWEAINGCGQDPDKQYLVFGRCSSSFAMIKLSARGTAAFWKAWRGCSSQVSPMNSKAKIIATLYLSIITI